MSTPKDPPPSTKTCSDVERTQQPHNAAALTLPDMADRLARLRLPVFTLSPAGKPLCPQWWTRATADPASARAMFTASNGSPRVDVNLGICTGGDTPSGLAVIVIDVDVKGGAPGLTSLETLTARGMPPTLTMLTKSGGLHFIYEVEASFWYKSIQGRLAYLPGIDVKGTHGFVVGPGSIVNGGEYSILHDRPIAPAPDWLVADVKKEKLVERSNRAGAPYVRGEADTPEVEEVCKNYLRSEAPAEPFGPDEEAGHFHDTLIGIAHGCMDRGASPAFAAELIIEHWTTREDCCDADPEIIRYQVGQHPPRRNSPIGARTPLLEAFDFEDEAVGMVERTRAVEGKPGASLDDDILDGAGGEIEEIDWIIEGVSPARGACVTIAGQSRAGKTFVAVKMAIDAAIGRPFYKREIDERVGAYFLLWEGDASDMKKRVAAYKLQHGIEGDLPIAWRFMDCRLTDPHTMADVKHRIARLNALFQARHGVRLGLLFVDTLVAACRPENESDAAEMTAIIMKLKRLARETRTTVIPIMHLNKTSPEISGSYASVAYSDVILSAAAEFNVATGVHKDRRLVMTKNRFGPTGELGGFDLKLVKTGVDRKGRLAGSAATIEKGVADQFSFATAYTKQCQPTEAFDGAIDGEDARQAEGSNVVHLQAAAQKFEKWKRLLWAVADEINNVYRAGGLVRAKRQSPDWIGHLLLKHASDAEQAELSNDRALVDQIIEFGVAKGIIERATRKDAARRAVDCFVVNDIFR